MEFYQSLYDFEMPFPQNHPNTAMKSPGEPYTRFILYHHTQNGTTVIDSRFQHSTG